MKIGKITATENGPYRVERVKKVVNARGDVLGTDEEMWLCRCGGSGNKPFCDGTHKTNGFSGVNPEIHMTNETVAYEGKDITIYDNRNICSHRGYCTGELPTVFKETEPWIDPDGDTADKIMALCDKCPSGALSYALKDQDRHQGHAPPPQVRLSEKHFGFHGPYDVTGHVSFEGQLNRAPESPNKMTLCRCGHSKNKPFCSGEHYNIGFIDAKNDID